MAEVTIQGVLSIGANDLYVTASNTTARVKYLKFYNPAAYSITVSKYDFSLSSTINLYSLNLDPGDSISDDTQYLLQGRDKLSVTATTANTTYLILLDVT